MADRDIFTIIREDVLRWLLQRLNEKQGIGGWEHLENWMQVELWSRLENTLPEEYTVLNMEPPKIITGKSGREKWLDMLIFSEGQRQFFWWEIKYLGKEKSVARNTRSFINDFHSLLAMDIPGTCNDMYTKQRAKDKREILIKKFENTEFRNAFLRSDHYAVGLVALNKAIVGSEDLINRMKKELALADSDIIENELPTFYGILATSLVRKGEPRRVDR